MATDSQLRDLYEGGPVSCLDLKSYSYADVHAIGHSCLVWIQARGRWIANGTVLSNPAWSLGLTITLREVVITVYMFLDRVTGMSRLGKNAHQ